MSQIAIALLSLLLFLLALTLARARRERDAARGLALSSKGIAQVVSILSEFCGEVRGNKGEGAVETLTRLVAEIRAGRAAAHASEYALARSLLTALTTEQAAKDRCPVADSLVGSLRRWLGDPGDPIPGVAEPVAPPSDLSRHCIIIPHAGPQPDALTVDLHTAALHVLQRSAYRDAVDIRDPMDVTDITRTGPDGSKQYATVIRWYAAGERPIDEMGLDDAPAPADPAALPRLDGAVSYERPPA